MRSSRWQVGALAAGGVAVAAMWGGVMRVHPNDAGHRALATAFVEAWRSR